MTVYAAPGATFEANISGGTTGLVGTIGVRVSNLVTDTDVIARQTSGIAEYPVGSGIYSVSLVAPTVAGTYSIIWDATVFASEDLVVTSSTPGGSLPLGTDLTSLAAVRAYLKKPTQDTGDDDEFQALITAASQEITLYCQREFTPDAGNPRTHRFRSSDRLIDLAPFDLQSATTVTLDPQSSSPTTLTEWTDYDLFPIDTSSIGTYYQFKLHRHVTTTRDHVIIDVTGTWGAASIPAIVSKACDITVAQWYRGGVTAFSTTFNADAGGIIRAKALPDAVMAMLSPYCRILL